MNKEAQMAKAMVKAYEEALKSVLDQAHYITEEAALNVRMLLVPILQRWGIGLRKGGVMAYPKVGGGGLPSWTEVRLVSDEGYALRVVHPELYELLCAYNQVINKRVYEYVEDIPVGLDNIPWVWLTSVWGDSDEPVIGVVPCPHSGEPGKEYYGPINQSLYDEVLAHGGDMVLFLNTLPQYEVDPDGAWVEIENWFREVKGSLL